MTESSPADMPRKSSFLFIIFIAFGLQRGVVSAQDTPNGINLSKHTVGYGISYTYPKLADGSKNAYVISDFNFGLSAAFEWGKYYHSGISFMVSPLIYYSNYNNSQLIYESYHFKDDKLTYRTKSTIHYKEWAVYLPISYEFPLFRTFRLGVGASVAVPLASSGSVKREEFDYYISGGSQGGYYINPFLREEHTYDIDHILEPELAVNSKFLYQIHTNEKVESYLSLEYWYTISVGEPAYIHKTRFALTYTQRFIQLKEVREKWDRYWIKKNKRNQ